jgi:hypothetical protein
MHDAGVPELVPCCLFLVPGTRDFRCIKDALCGLCRVLPRVLAGQFALGRLAALALTAMGKTRTVACWAWWELRQAVTLGADHMAR